MSVCGYSLYPQTATGEQGALYFLQLSVDVAVGCECMCFVT